ncbi:hypothetical protein MVQ18_10960, partial [Fusobacterium necrophorum]|nr:hypothetical protein [Fusobacterium necrophorum]
AYYDSNTKNMFYCKETNSYTSANSSYFEPFDNKELLNRLNNLDRKTTLKELKNSKITNNGSYVTIPDDFQLVIVFYSIGC